MVCLLETQTTVLNEKSHLHALSSDPFTHRKEPNITSLYLLNINKISGGLKIMYSAPSDSTKSLAVWGAKQRSDGIIHFGSSSLFVL